MARRDAFPLGAAVTLEQLAGDPHAVLAGLRSNEPVSWLPAMSGWLVTRRDLAIEVLRDAATFTVDHPRFSTAQVIGPSMLSLDGAEHERHRRPFAGPFRAADVRDLFTAWTATRARDLVAGLAPAGAAELRTGLAAPLAADVVTEALGLVGIERATLLEWYDAFVAAVDDASAGRAVSGVAQEAFAELRTAVTVSVAAGDSLLASVAATGDLSETEVASNAAVLLFGGIVTSEGATANALYQLLARPDQLAAVMADRSLVMTAVEESLRFEPAAAVVDRYATRSVRLAGAPVAAGDLVRVSLAAANRDPATFPDPDRFDVRRPNAHHHLAFARGPHACLGIHLARLETCAAVDAVLDLLPDLRLDAAASTPPEGLIFRKPPRVVARWGAA